MDIYLELKNIIDGRMISNWPEPRIASDYDDVREDYIKSLDVPVRAIYQVGSVGAPGISDLDLFVVLENDTNASFADFSISNLTEKQRYIMMHEPWVINKSIFKKLNKIFPYFDLVQVYGEPMAPSKSDHTISKIDAFIFLSEYTVTKIPRSLVDLLHAPEALSARLAIVLINSLRHSIVLYYRSGGNSVHEWNVFIKNFDIFRKQGLTGSRNEEHELRKHLYQSLIISFQLIEKVGQLSQCFLVENNTTYTPVEDGILRGFFSARFLQNWSVELALNEAIRQYKYAGHWLILPSSLGLYWEAVPANNRFGKYISKMLNYNSGGKLRIYEGINTHVEAVDEYIQFSHKNLSYRGSIWITMGAGDSFFVRNGRLIKIYLKRLACFLKG